MNFSSLKEYFYRLYNACLSRVLFTMGLYLLIYYLLLTRWITPYIEVDSLINFLRYTFLVLIIIALTIVHLAVIRQLRNYAMTVGLGDKLDLYYGIVKIKARTLLSISIFCSVALLLTGDQWFSLYFAGMLVWLFLQWPTPKKVCRHLNLRGDERTMVLTKGEAFQF